MSSLLGLGGLHTVSSSVFPGLSFFDWSLFFVNPVSLAGPQHRKSIRLQVATEGERAALSPNGPAAPKRELKTGLLQRAVQVSTFAQVERTFQQI